MTRSRPLLSDLVRSELRRAIISGEFAPDSKLPNEDQLSERFAVSRITLREAVRGLIEDGYVVRRQGAGTFVTRGPRLRHSLDSNFSYSDYLEASGIQTSQHVLAMRLAPAGEETAAALGLAAETDVIEIERLRRADGRPAIFSIDRLPTDIVDAERDREGLGSLYKLLNDRGHTVAYARASLLPVVADSWLADTLQVPQGTPLQQLRQVDHDGQDRPVLLSLEWHVPSIIEFTVYRRGPGPLANAE